MLVVVNSTHGPVLPKSFIFTLKGSSSSSSLASSSGLSRPMECNFCTKSHPVNVADRLTVFSLTSL